MKTYFTKTGLRGLVSFSSENNDIDLISYITTNIDWVYRIPEDGVLKTENKEQAVKKDDIVVQFYKTPFEKNDVIVIRNKEWKENLKAYDEFIQKSNPSNPSCECCDAECKCLA